MIAKIDGALLRFIYTPISQWAGRRFGSTAGSLSRACIPPMVVFSAMHLMLDDGSMAVKFTVMFLVLCIAVMFWISSSMADSTPNPFELEQPGLRFYWVLCVLFIDVPKLFFYNGDLPYVCELFSGIACISHVYFRAVPAPPPKKRKEPKFSAWALPEGA